MKLVRAALVALALAFGASAVAQDRPIVPKPSPVAEKAKAKKMTRAQKFQAQLRADKTGESKAAGLNPMGWKVVDTGDKIDLGAGEGPIVIVSHPSIPHECMVALHPTQDLSAMLGCVPVEPKVKS
ncbi:MAG TPA: hypothetical protein VD931_22825 [Baekduia sp.]|nr:hypothetical protein [Baekduia sp.]